MTRRHLARQRHLLDAAVGGAAVLLAAGAPLAAPAPATAASVETMVVGKSRTLSGPRSVVLRERRATVGTRSCAIGAATPLSVLLATRLPVAIEDRGVCGRSPRDAGGLMVTGVGPDRNRGRDGWAFKVGRRAGTRRPADPSGPFGTGRGLRDGQRVLWFWCVRAASGGCQRTLEVSAGSGGAGRGQALRVRVRGFDDRGRGAAIAGATVRLGTATGRTGADGTAVVTVPADARGSVELTAEREGMVRAFPRLVAVR